MGTLQKCTGKLTLVGICTPANAATAAQIWISRRHRSAKFQEWPTHGCGAGGCVTGERTMTKLVIDIVLFSCIFAFVTGIVIAAANLLI